MDRLGAQKAVFIIERGPGPFEKCWHRQCLFFQVQAISLCDYVPIGFAELVIYRQLCYTTSKIIVFAGAQQYEKMDLGCI